MKKISDYTVLSADHNDVLGQRVRFFLEKGWQPYGYPGAICNKNTDMINYMQAIVKYEELKDNKEKKCTDDIELKMNFLNELELVHKEILNCQKMASLMDMHTIQEKLNKLASRVQSIIQSIKVFYHNTKWA